jgi:hypothetical protein
MFDVDENALNQNNLKQTWLIDRGDGPKIKGGQCTNCHY